MHMSSSILSTSCLDQSSTCIAVYKYGYSQYSTTVKTSINCFFHQCFEARSHTTACKRWCSEMTRAVIFFSKLNYLFFWYFDPENIFLDNENKWFSGWPKRYFGWNGNTGQEPGSCNPSIGSRIGYRMVTIHGFEQWKEFECLEAIRYYVLSNTV